MQVVVLSHPCPASHTAVRPAITEEVAKSVACALVGARLDYANSVLYGVSQHNIARLQRVQNALARVVIGPSVTQRSDPNKLLQRLHWLPVAWRINYKIATFAFKVQSNSAPSYLCHLLSLYRPSRCLRSSNELLLTVPRYKLLFGSRAFRISAPVIFNALPSYVRSCNTLLTFRKHLKTFYFTRAFVAT